MQAQTGNTDILRDIIEQLLELTGPETGHHIMRPQPTDLSAVATAAAAAADLPPNIRLHIDVPAMLTRHADPHRLRQILDELLGNAIKYSPDGGDIHLGVHNPADGVVELTVTDTGLGMPAFERELPTTASAPPAGTATTTLASFDTPAPHGCSAGPGSSPPF